MISTSRCSSSSLILVPSWASRFLVSRKLVLRLAIDLSATDDEIGRRMGSNFSEGAIVQHIAKLRSKMADLNVAPVPAPPKRGQIASRPSSVYTTKARAGPPPSQPPTTTKGRGRRAQTAKPTGVTKARAPRKGNGRTIKRSESDIDDDDDEEEDYEVEDNEYPNTSSERARRSSGQSNPDRRVSNAHLGRSQVGKAISRLFATDTSDSGASPFTFPNYFFPQDQSALPYASIEQNQAHSPYGYNEYSNYSLQEGSAGDEEEEEEDDSLPLMARKAALQSQAYQFPSQPQPQSSHNTSPRSQSQMVTLQIKYCMPS